MKIYENNLLCWPVYIMYYIYIYMYITFLSNSFNKKSSLQLFARLALCSPQMTSLICLLLCFIYQLSYPAQFAVTSHYLFKN